MQLYRICAAYLDQNWLRPSGTVASTLVTQFMLYIITDDTFYELLNLYDVT